MPLFWRKLKNIRAAATIAAARLAQSAVVAIGRIFRDRGEDALIDLR